MQDLEQERQEALLRRSQQGDRARIATEELDEFFRDRTAQILSKFRVVKTPNAAFELAIEYKTIMDFVGSARASVAAGDDANKKLTSEE
jgi:hypothetical protein